MIQCRTKLYIDIFSTQYIMVSESFEHLDWLLKNMTLFEEKVSSLRNSGNYDAGACTGRCSGLSAIAQRSGDRESHI